MTLHDLLAQAVTRHQAGDFPGAEALYRQAVADAPGDARILHQLALVLFHQGRLEDCLGVLRQALMLSPGAPELLVLEGVVLAGSGRRDAALAAFERALAGKPDHPGALFNRALALTQMERFGEAVEAYDRFLAVVPDSVDAWTNRGAALQGLWRMAEALESYDRAITLAPGHVPAWQNRGSVLQLMNRFVEALESFEKVLALAPRHAGGWYGRGGALMALERFEESLQSFDTSLEILPGQPGALQQREALVEIIKLFAWTPDGADAFETWRHRAFVQHIRQNFDAALESCDQALALKPDNSEMMLHKAAILNEARRVSEGLALYRRHAELQDAAQPVTADSDMAHKKRHDAEQKDYLTRHGITARGFYLDAGARTKGPAVNPANAGKVAHDWRETRPQIVVIDDLLTPEGLAALQHFCWASTIWRKPYAQGYLGAMPGQGFACPLLSQIADELRDVFPTVMGDFGLRLMWGFKYDSSLSGIPMHADQAAVNVNFWITPEEANLDKDSGGLVVWDIKAPLSWDFASYNMNAAKIRAFLTEQGAKPRIIPYRCNRAVVFDSDLFHETDTIRFAQGYENRRLNITMLYGRRAYYGG